MLRLAQRSLLRRLLGARGAAFLILLGALSVVPVALAEDAPAPPPPTTVPDAPPPDRYEPPAPAPKPAPARSASPAPTRSYTPPAASTPTPVRIVRGSTPTGRASAKHTAKKRRHVVQRRAETASPKVTLAPVAEIVAAAQLPIPSARAADDDSFLWAAGVAFAFLAVAGLSLQLLCMRVYNVRVE